MQPPTPDALHLRLIAPWARHEEIVSGLVAPLAQELQGQPRLRALFFGRYSAPDPHVGLTMLGDGSWLEREVRGAIRRLGEGFLEVARDVQVAEAPYDRQAGRFGGDEAAALAEEVFYRDTLACLEWMETERAGRCARARRELNVVLTERLLDLMGLERACRLALYRQGFRWAETSDGWSREDRRRLDERYAAVKRGLADLLWGQTSGDPAAVWGGEEAARIARECLQALEAAIGRLRRAHAAGRVGQDLAYLAFTFAHMNANRLGIGAAAEAILRYFVYRLMRDGEDVRSR